LVRDRQFNNSKFYRQKIIFYEFQNRKKYFIADFFCHEKKLIIELDGRIHEGQKEYDKIREEILHNLNLKVIRFSNEEIENHLENVITKLNKILE
jgi:very-short-patch-repair endonuclease